MSLYKQNGSPFWSYYFTFQGKRYRQSTGEKTKAAASTVEAAALTRLTQGLDLPLKSAKTPTLREFSARFIAWSGNSIALEPATKKYYEYGVRLLLLTRLADMPMDRIKGEHVECTTFVRAEGQPCSATYTNQGLRTLKVLFGKAMEWEVIRSRPKFTMAKSRGRDRLIDHDTEIRLQEQMQAPTAHGRHNRMREQAWLVMVILQDTGMRPDEVYPMRIENVDLVQRRIWVPKGKTPKARRFVGMSGRMHAMLVKWCLGREGWVFPSKRSASGHLEGIAKGFQEARKRAGLDSKVVPYCARHTYGTYQMEATGNTFAVSASMGHAGVKSMEPYQHADTSMLNKAIDERNHETQLRRFERTKRHTSFHSEDVIM